MKREIKFRGIILNGKGWVFGDLVHDTIDAYSRIVKIGIKTKENYPISVIPESVGQYTGLKDSKGVDIYEGDIMEVDKSIYSVVWSDAAFAALSPGSEAIDWHYSGFFERSKAIGNIHEHKHLLK